MLIDTSLKGVHGWLAFFVVALCAIGPGMSLVNTYMAFELLERDTPGATSLEGWQHYKNYIWAALAATTGLRWFAGYRLTSVFRPSSVRIAIAALWASMLAVAAAPFFAAYAALAEAPTDTSAIVIELAKGAIVSATWTAYLLRSRRVKNTYYSGLPGTAP